MKNQNTIFDLDALTAQFESEEWELDEMNDCRVKHVFLGTVMSLTPSGKFYMPWAHSNIESCPVCQGKSVIPGHKSVRVRQRNKARYHRMMKLAMKRGPDYARAHFKQRNAAHHRWQNQCPFCDGVGSREAYLDEIWREKAEEELSTIGASLESGEGDPCDLFAVISTPLDEDEEENGD